MAKNNYKIRYRFGKGLNYGTRRHKQKKREIMEKEMYNEAMNSLELNYDIKCGKK